MTDGAKILRALSETVLEIWPGAIEPTNGPAIMIEPDPWDSVLGSITVRRSKMWG